VTLRHIADHLKHSTIWVWRWRRWYR